MILSKHSTQTLACRVIFLFVISIFSAVVANGQADRRAADELLYEKVQRLTDSVNNLNHDKAPLYIGYEVSFAVPQFILNSDINKLDGLHASFLGSSAGVVVGNHRGKVKANYGFFYSDDATAYTIGLTRASISSNIYLLRTGAEVKYHTIEPYAIVGMSHMSTKFYGNYLDPSQKKYSKNGEEALLGKTHAGRAFVGGGFEFQLESDTHKFVHIFAEVTFSRSLTLAASNAAFERTSAQNALLVSVGVNFGKRK